MYGNCFYLQQNITPSGFAIKGTAAGKITRTEVLLLDKGLGTTMHKDQIGLH